MINARSVRSLRIAIAALFLSAAPVAHAEMYRWIDAEGSVTYSNQPPADRSSVRELTKIEDINTVPSNQRPKGPLATQPEKRGPDSSLALPESVSPKLEVPAVKAESASPTPQLAPPVAATPRPAFVTAPPTTLLQQEPVTLLPRESGALQQPEAESAPARVIPRSRHTEAVQDPCLTSSDPKCYQRNKDSYHPHLGYAPGIQSTGASTGAGAGGVVGGQVAAPSVVAPKSTAHALPPGSASPAALTPAKQPSAMR